MSDIPTIRTPRSTPAATALCERYAEIEAAIAAAEGERNAAIAGVNAKYDPIVAPLVADRDLIAGKLEPWWRAAAAELTGGKRKSIELGGCMIGTKQSRATLQVAGAEDDVVNLLRGFRWAAPLLKVKYSLDRLMVLKSIDGKHKLQLAELGLSAKAGEDVFFVARAEQGGTVAR